MSQFAFLIFKVLFVLQFSLHSSAQTCVKIFHPQRQLSTVKKIRILNLNGEGLVMKVGKEAELSDSEFYDRHRVSPKSPKQVQIIADTIAEINPDFAIIQETDKNSLNHFASVNLKNKWISYLIEGNDNHHIGFLVKTDLPLKAELRSHRHEKWENPSQAYREEFVFTRDVPALILRRENDPTPVLILLGAHAHSRTTARPGQDLPAWLQAEKMAIAKVIENLKIEFGPEAPIVLGIDANTAIDAGKEMAPIYNQLSEAFDSTGYRLPKYERYTHYITIAGRRVLRQIDAVFTNFSLSRFIEQAFVARFKLTENLYSKKLSEIPVEEVGKNPTDHAPVVIVLSTKTILPEAHR